LFDPHWVIGQFAGTDRSWRRIRLLCAVVGVFLFCGGVGLGQGLGQGLGTPLEIGVEDELDVDDGIGDQANAAAGVAPSAQPRVMLRGSGVHESAPHGRGNVYAPCVMRDGATWRLWYGGQGEDGHDRIGLAESEDGVHWSRRGVVLDDPAANHINDPEVFKVGDRYHMLYTRAAKEIIDEIHWAESEDGVRWEPRGVALAAGPAGSWDGLSVGRPTVARAADGRYLMWYDGRKDFAAGSPVSGVPLADDSHRYVGVAISEDGARWNRFRAEPVFGNDAGGIDVKRVGERYVMLYESGAGVMHAVSVDGIRWEQRGLCLAKSDGKADRFGHVTPALWFDPAAAFAGANALDGEGATLKTSGWGKIFFGAAAAASWDNNAIASAAVDLKRLVGPSDAAKATP
jgi:predicted GH43/DUF377 family glycosyl hydrolase